MSNQQRFSKVWLNGTIPTIWLDKVSMVDNLDAERDGLVLVMHPTGKWICMAEPNDPPGQWFGWLPAEAVRFATSLQEPTAPPAPPAPAEVVPRTKTTPTSSKGKGQAK